MRIKLAVTLLFVAGVALVAWLALRAPDPTASDAAARSARPRTPQRDEQLEAMLSELMRVEVDSSEVVDELERLELAQPERPPASENAAPGRSASEHAVPAPPSPATDVSNLLLSDDRVPNTTRVDGLEGPFVSAAWPNGTTMFEAGQARDEDGAWRLDGSWRAWYPNTQIEELGGYVQGFEHGAWSWWYSNGALMARGSFDEGVRVGEWAFWHPNGVVIGEGAYVDGRRSGRWTFRDALGRVREDFSGEYDFGSRVGP